MNRSQSKNVVPRQTAAGLPPGHRSLHVAVPIAIFNHAKAQAYLSNMAWPAYIAQVLKDAKAYEPPRP